MKLISNRSGITLLETIIVLIIGGLIISGIWVAYSEAALNDKIRRTTVLIDKTATATWDYLSTRNEVPANLSLEMHEKNLMPSDLVVRQLTSGLAIYTSPLSMSFYVSSCAGCTTTRFVIRVGVTSTQCKRLIPAMIGNFGLVRERNIIGFAVGTISRGEQGNGARLEPGDLLTPDEIIEHCALSEGIFRLFYKLRP